MVARSLRVVLIAALAVGSFVGLAGQAGAHGADGTFTPIVSEPVEGRLGANLRVTLIFNNDTDPVDDAAVKVTPTGADGTTAAPVMLLKSPEPGTYEGVVPVNSPGTWTFAVTSEDPEAALDIVVNIPEPAPKTTPAPATTPATKAPDTVIAPPPAGVATSLVEPVAVDPTTATVDSATTAVDGSVVEQPASEDNGFPWGIAVVVLVVAAAVVMVMAYAMRTGGGDPEAPNGPDTGPGPVAPDEAAPSPPPDGA
ncbi:MAG: hypothetical protein IPI82_15490 [Candidatus Microthrix sp.]|nr:hypothetical protein [Candidatus Microthrix sp.]MBK7323801.1 hypothetical protein [Candidatus Microthrix sp.]